MVNKKHFTKACSDSTRDNGFKLREYFHWIRGFFFLIIMRVVRQNQVEWHLSKQTQLNMSLLIAGWLDLMITEGPFQVKSLHKAMIRLFNLCRMQDMQNPL